MPMREYKRRAWLGAIVVFSLLAGAFVPAPVLAGAAALPASAPDLVIETISWSPEIPAIGNTVTFTVTLKNQGGGPASPSQVNCYIDDTRQAPGFIGQINAGATAAQAFTWKAQAGSHTVRAVADANNAVAESSEVNNEKTVTMSVPAPDLVVSNITWSPETPSVGDTVTFSVTVKNEGTEVARYSYVDLAIDGYYRGFRDVPHLEPGAVKTVAYDWVAQVGSYAIRAVADANNGVAESDEANNARTLTYATAAPDLIIKDITWSPAGPTEGSTVTFTVTIKNQGSGRAESSRVSCYIDDMFQSAGFIDAIEPGAESTKTFEWKAQAGSHAVRGVADVNNVVAESDENNNEKTVTYATGASDLIIQDITWSPASPLIGHLITFTVSVKNQGKSRVGNSCVYFYIDDYRWQQDLGDIAAGATVTALFTWTIQKDSHVANAVADAKNNVIESDESNNTKAKAVGSSIASLPDLVVQNIAWSPASPSPGDTATFTVSVKNQGIAQANPSHIAYYVDDGHLATEYINQISGGASATNTFTWTVVAGTHTIRAVADCNSSVPETSEGNNEKTATLSVLASDLLVQNITWSPLHPPAGDTVTFTVMIKNRGSDRARHSFIAYYLDGASIGFSDVPGIDADAAVAKTFTWMAQAGAHTIRAVADMDNQVPETDEGNNEKVVNFPPPDLVIEQLTWSPENPTENSTMAFAVTVKNEGPGGAGSVCIDLYIDDSALGQEAIPGIDAGASVTRNFTWKARAGSHNIRVVADAENDVVETDEANNEKSADFSASLPPEAPPAPVPGPVSISRPKPLASVKLSNQSGTAVPGEDVIFNLDAANDAASPGMTIKMVLIAPPEVNITSAEFSSSDKEKYTALYNIKPGDSRKIAVHVTADEAGVFNIMGDLAYYFGEDLSTVEHQTLSLTVIAEAETPIAKLLSALSSFKDGLARFLWPW